MTSVSWEEKRGFVVRGLDGTLGEALSEMQGGRRSGKAYVVPPSWPVAVRLSEIVPMEHWSPEALDAAMDLDGAAGFLSGLGGRKVGSVVKTEAGELSEVQQQGAVWLAHARAAMLCDEMGSGKTVQACVAMDRLEGQGLRRALVVCPASVIRAWCDHIAHWTENVVAVPLAGDAGSRRTAIGRALKDDNAVVFVASWSILSRMSRIAHWPTAERTEAQRQAKELNGIAFDLLILDEAHRAKNPEALQTRAAWEIDAARRWCLTGTPVANRPEDFWSLLRMIDPLAWPSKRKFVAEFCRTHLDEWGAQVVDGWDEGRLGRLGRFVAPCYRRMTMADAIGRDIEKVRQRRAVVLPKAHRKQYDAIEGSWVVQAGDEESWTPDALSRLTRLTQCALAPLEIEGDKIAMIGPSPKVAELRQLLEDLPPDESLVVFSASRQLLALAAEMLARHAVSHAVVTGDVSADDRASRVRQFQEGEARVFLGTTQAAGEGLDLSRARIVVHLSKLWSKAMTDQAEDRVRRWTQGEPAVLVVDIVAEGTIEARIERVLKKKGELLEAVTPKELSDA